MSIYLNGQQNKQDLIAKDLFDKNPLYKDDSSKISDPNSNLFIIQASLISNGNKFEYQSARGLVITIQDIVDSGCAEKTSGFLYFSGLDESQFDSIEEQLQLFQQRSSVRFTFENVLNATILRIMPGPEHEKVGFRLVTEIVIKIASIPGHTHRSVEGVGATRFKVPGVRSKEGDQGLHPETRVGRDAWPSIMIEVGYSEGLDLLHLDAQWWLIHSKGETRFVLIAKIHCDPFFIHLECWRMAPTQRSGPQTRQTSPWSPMCVQTFDINAAGVVVSPTRSTELRIPYDCIFDQASVHAPPILFTFTELS
ncbi:hypothetical protein HOY82DRAFT_644895 [Tuber indicum]|nr:hypothetical protein HOY82DRAFT_644895 [Tuber indicum]